MKKTLRTLYLGLAAGCLLIPAAALADSISPATFTDTIVVGETTTINKTVTITPEVTTAKVDVFFLTDTTGSMGTLITSVKNSASAILASASDFGDVAFGVGEYKDFTDSYAYRLNTAITTNTAAVQSGINLYGAGGGGDYEEANLFALNAVATSAATGWRTDSTRILVWFGDAAGHEPSGGVTEATATAALVSKNIVVEAMNVGTLDYTGQATRIAAATGGTYYASINTSAIVDTINDAITSVFATYEEVSLDVTGVPAGLSVSVVPGSYTGEFTRDALATYTFDVALTGVTPGTYDFAINALVDKGIVATERDSITVTGGPVSVPEPAAMLLIGTGLFGLISIGRKRAKKN